MTWDKALADLGNGTPVYRTSWPEGDYLDPQFYAPGDDPERFPYRDRDDIAFAVIRYTDGGSATGQPFTPSPEDQAASDWECA